MKTHPLTPAALAVLRDLAKHPLPCQEINPGVVNRLQREDLVDTVAMVSPYKTHKGRKIAHLRASAAGLAVLASTTN